MVILSHRIAFAVLMSSTFATTVNVDAFARASRAVPAFPSRLASLTRFGRSHSSAQTAQLSISPEHSDRKLRYGTSFGFAN
jgi:hypothetical protein